MLRLCVGLAGVRSAACCGVITCPPGLGTLVPRGVKWNVPASRAEGWPQPLLGASGGHSVSTPSMCLSLHRMKLWPS